MSTPLPWDRFGQPPAPVEEERELPYVPPPDPTPVAPDPVEPPLVVPEDENFWDAIRNTVRETMAEEMPKVTEDLRRDAMGYGKDTVLGTITGREIDHANPTVTVTTSQGQELVVADAKSRSWRTFLQGLGLDLMFAVVALLTATTTHAFDPLSKVAWVTFAALVVKTLLQTIAAYIMRIKITPTVKVRDQVAHSEKVAMLPLPVPLDQMGKVSLEQVNRVLEELRSRIPGL